MKFHWRSWPPAASYRAFRWVFKVARTIADVAGSNAIQPACLAEAIQYRQRRQH